MAAGLLLLAVQRTGASAAQPLTPAVVVSSDGLASLHVERMPVEWVLAQIARQHPKGALLPSPAGSRPAPAATAGTRAQPAFVPECAATAGDSSAVREALQAALYVPSAAIQREAQRRLDELTQGERIDAASPQVAGR